MNRILFVVTLGIAGLIATESSSDAQFKRRMQRPGQGAQAQGVDYEFTVLESPKVRMLKPPVEFDAKGKPITKYTGEELIKRKGSTPAEQRLPGVKCELSVVKPGDVVQVTFSRPSDPKNLDKSKWTTLPGQMAGVVTNVDAGTDGTLMTVRVYPNGPPQVGQGGGNGGKGGRGRAMLGGDAPKNVIKPAQRQASMIMIVEQAPDQEMKMKRGKKKKNDN